MMLDLDPDKTALFLDFDGTLVDLAPRPDAIAVADDLPDLLNQTSRRFGGAVAIVSGRPLAEIDRFLAPANLPASGLHGLEWRPDANGPVRRAEMPPAIVELRVALGALPWPDGVMIEDKGLSIALHYREAPEAEALVRARLTALAESRPEVTLLDGKMVAEIKPAGASKATAVERFLERALFAERVPVFVGDDVTDEDGMRIAIARGGFGIKVGAGDSLAEERLAGVGEVHAWLRRLAAVDA